MSAKPRVVCLLTAALVTALAACGGGGPEPPAPGPIQLTSAAFASGGTIPTRFTCDGDGLPPPVGWSRVPAAARELVLVMQDPGARGGTFVHWSVLAIAPGTEGLPAGTKPATLRLGRNSKGAIGYRPPCPREGDPAHRYVFTLHALSAPSELAQGASIAEVRRVLAQRTIARGTLIGRYARR